LLQIYREKAEQRRTATLKQGTEAPDTQNIGEREKGEAIAQFAAAVHSNPEKAEQRQLSQNFGGVGPKSEGKSLEQFAGKDEQGNPVFSVRQNFAEPKGVTLLVGKGIQQQDLMVRQNIAEPSDTEGKAIDQFAKTIHSNPETVRQALYIEEHATPKRIETVKKGLFLQVYIFFCETIETLRESKDTFTIH